MWHGRPMNTPAAFPPAGLRKLLGTITRRTGLHYYTDKTDLLEEMVGARMRLHGCPTCHDYLAMLDDGARGDGEWRELESVLTIGETFFFRYAEQFAALERTILPALIRGAQAARGLRRQLRIWSVGCSNGAEPYSIAIVITRLLEKVGQDVRDWQIEILGTDISTRALEQARKAEFSAWTLRDIEPAWRAAWFSPVTPRLWQLHECYRRMVTFRYSNVLDMLRPDGGPAGPFDLVLCRNVLIYFAPEQATALVHALAGRLAPQGWLLLGHSEPGTDFAPWLETVRLPGTRAFRASAPQVEPARQPGTRRRPARASAPALATPDGPVTVDSAAIAAAIRRTADDGHVARAMQMCRDHLGCNPVDARIHFLFAVLAWGEGCLAQAEDSFRRVIYLCRDHVMARCYLARLLEDAGVGAEALRIRQQMVALARRCAPDMALPDGDGLTAGGLLRLVRHMDDAPPFSRTPVSS